MGITSAILIENTVTFISMWIHMWHYAMTSRLPRDNSNTVIAELDILCFLFNVFFIIFYPKRLNQPKDQNKILLALFDFTSSEF
jgi:hypothetical protein